jgi:GNAT superfamily N-acetyltransferase
MREWLSEGVHKKDRLGVIRNHGVEMPNAQLAEAPDLTLLLDLYRFSEVSSIVQPEERAEQIWAEMLSLEGVSVFVSYAGAKIVATSTLITAPNLLRSGQRQGFLENVVTHPELRGQGHGRAVMQAALAAAWAKDCYHVLLQSGRKDPECIAFTKAAASSQGFGSVTLRAALALSFLQLAHLCRLARCKRVG